MTLHSSTGERSRSLRDFCMLTSLEALQMFFVSPAIPGAKEIGYNTVPKRKAVLKNHVGFILKAQAHSMSIHKEQVSTQL